MAVDEEKKKMQKVFRTFDTLDTLRLPIQVCFGWAVGPDPRLSPQLERGAEPFLFLIARDCGEETPSDWASIAALPQAV